jgi:hypothetical protein
MLNCGACCAPQTCGESCGSQADGCGGVLDCGPCCTPQTCGSVTCGQVPDGCGGLLDCGQSGCCKPQTCAAACAALPGGSVCSAVEDAAAFPIPCQQADGCGKQMQCWCGSTIL